MPEGHTLHRLAKDLGADLAGEVVGASSPQGRFADAARLDGKKLLRAEAVGKHLLLHFARGLVVHVHLGLFGRFRRRRTPAADPRPTTRLRLVGVRATWDLSGPTRCEIASRAQVAALRARLGADPLAPEADVERAWTAFHRTKRAVGAVLLDQTVFAGVGNVYRAELLFVLGLHPETPAARLDRATFDAIWDKARTWLARGVADKRIVTVDVPAGTRPKRGEAVHVYRRSRCRVCGSDVRRWQLAARTIHACPTCQPWKDAVPAR